MMPFVSERRLFFKKDRGVVRISARIILLIGLSMLAWELGSHHGTGHERAASTPLTPPLTEPTMVTTTASRKKDVRSDDDAPVRVRVISHTLSGYSKSPPGSFNDDVNSLNSKTPTDVAKSNSVATGTPDYAPTSRSANEPPKSKLSTAVKVDQHFTANRVQPKVPQPRAKYRRSRMLRARAKKPSTSASQPLFQDLPKWADRALSNRVN